MSTKPHIPEISEGAPPVPLVVRVGFAGSRSLYDRNLHPTIVPEDFAREVQRQLIEQLHKLRADLKLHDRHFLCGISQIAIGADTVFTRCCQALGIPQRIFLPHHRDSYLDARNAEGERDFSPADQQFALELLASPHLIHECVVSDSFDRHERFRETNLEIMLASDVLICLVGENAPSKPGGTQELIAMAKRRRKPVLEILIKVVDGAPRLVPSATGPAGIHYQPPGLPTAIDAVPFLPGDGPFGSLSFPVPLPAGEAYAAHLNEFTSRQAQSYSKRFKHAAALIIGTHVFATLCAVVALTATGFSGLWGLLIIELFSLGIGLGIHEYLHWKKSPQRWAMCRLVSETTESVRAVGSLHLYLDHLFTLPFPSSMQGLLQTLNVLHLRSTAAHARVDWKEQGGTLISGYLSRRFAGRRNQVLYHSRESEKALRSLHWARRIFIGCSLLAFAATLTKLLVECHCIHLPHTPTHELCGGLAIFLPVLAVAVLSLAAALDLEARAHTFGDAFKFLEHQQEHLLAATSRRDFARLVLETESRLLGETANWYARRSFTGVA
jgi:uncharacterized RDD family membrane protein YckC